MKKSAIWLLVGVRAAPIVNWRFDNARAISAPLARANATCGKQRSVAPRVETVATRQPKYKVEELEVRANPDLECPDGFELRDEVCYTATVDDPLFTCPEGWTREGDGCVGYRIAALEKVCSDPSGVCTKKETVPMQVVCGPGTTINHKTGMCTKLTRSSAYEVCPEGSYMIGEVCVETEAADIRFQCPTGYILNGGSCQKTSELAPEYSCPDGFKNDGYSCKKSRPTAARAECPSGTNSRNGDCIRESSNDATMRCSVGHLEGDKCIETKSIDILTKCRAGLTLSGVACVGEETVKPVMDCNNGFVYNKFTGKCGSAQETQPANKSCPPGFHFVSKDACSKKINEEPLYECPAGYVQEGNDCTKEKTTQPKYSCSDGMLLKGRNCVAQEHLSPRFICDSDTELKGTECIKVTTADPIKKCPTGSKLNGKACTVIDNVPVKEVCPSGFSRSEGECVRIHKVASTPRCATGTLVGGSCQSEVEIAPEEICPEGYYADRVTKQCFIQQNLPTVDICPRGYMQAENQCVKKEHAPLEPDCKPGMIYDPTRQLCFRETTRRPQNVCAPGFKYSNDEGLCVGLSRNYSFNNRMPIKYETTEAPEEEALLDMEIETPAPFVPETTTTTTTTTTTPEPEIQVVVKRPVVQKGLVVKDEEFVLTGPAAEVAKQQAILNMGGSIQSTRAPSYNNGDYINQYPGAYPTPIPPTQGFNLDYIPNVMPGFNGYMG